MRRFFCASLLCLFVVSALVPWVYAAPVETLSEDLPGADLVAVADISQDIDIVNVSATVYSVSANQTNGLTKLVLTLIGDYNPIVTDYEYRQGTNSYVSHSISVTPDWPWIISAGIFSLVLFCTLRIFGGAVCKT